MTWTTSRDGAQGAPWTHADLACGIGGFSVAASRLGGTIIWACDIDPTAAWACSRVAQAGQGAMAQAVAIEDKAHWGTHTGVDLISASFPCRLFNNMGFRRRSMTLGCNHFSPRPNLLGLAGLAPGLHGPGMRLALRRRIELAWPCCPTIPRNGLWAMGLSSARKTRPTTSRKSKRGAPSSRSARIFGRGLQSPFPTSLRSYGWAYENFPAGTKGWHGFFVRTPLGFRFLYPAELAVAQGFPWGYKWPPNCHLAWQLIGNSVPPPHGVPGYAWPCCGPHGVCRGSSNAWVGIAGFP